MASGLPGGGPEVAPELCDDAVAGVLREQDTAHGGFGGAPKFPPSALLEALMRHYERTRSPAALEAVARTGNAMARGGIYDQLGGGFARYSVDGAWVVPHFEKMLYDNALLLRAYAHWARRTGDPLARRVAAQTARFLLDELGSKAPADMFTSSLDADADGREGSTYVWTPVQLTEVLGGDDGRWAAEVFGVTEAGTFEHGTSVLQLPADPDDAARLDRVRAALLVARLARAQPARDDKVVTSWNGLAITALAEAPPPCPIPGQNPHNQHESAVHSAHSPYYRLVALRETSPRIHELIREAARIALNPTQEWLDEFDRAILAANPSIAADPALATVVKRSNRAHLIHFAAANLRNPGAPVPANLGPEPLRMARDLVRVGLDALALDIYRIGQNVAWRRWTDIAFGLTSDPDELHELLDVPFRTANEFVDTTLAGITTEMQLERDKLTRDVPAERRKIVQLLIDGAPISREHAEARLGYPLDRSHTAAVIWGDQAQGDHSHLDRVADAFGHAGGCPHPLVVVAGAATRWVWVKDAPGFDIDLIHEVLHDIPDARIAIGATAPGIEGFRRSHRDALTTARMIIRLESPHRVAFFTDVEMVALLTENAEGADDFIQRTLGNLESASPALKTTLLTFINQQCNASRAARLLFTHRNTLMNRLETAQRLLPRPLADTTIHVAVALEAQQWREKQTSDPPAKKESNGTKMR